MSEGTPNERSMTWVNGRLSPASEATVPAGDFGFLYGEGLFETMRARGERIAYLDRHLDRLMRSASVIGLPLPPERDLRRGLSELLAAMGEGERRVRLTVTRGAAGAYDRPVDAPPTVVITANPLSSRANDWRACWSPYRRDEANALHGIKSNDYLVNVLARRHARENGFDEALFLNTRGELAEGSSANLFLRVGDRLSTTPVGAGALPGVMRSVLIDRAAEAGRVVEEKSLTSADLFAADAAYMTNAVIGVVVLVKVDGQRIGQSADRETLERLRSSIWREDDFQALNRSKPSP